MIHALLTVDDVASRNTPAMVDYLRDKGIRAIFFATGENVERFYEEACYALKNGMILGNHSYSHPHFSQLSMEACANEIEKCEQVLDQLYHDCGIQREYRPFRFPYGDKGGENREALQAYFREKGFDKVDDTQIPYSWWAESGLNRDIDTLWTFDFEEYHIRPARVLPGNPCGRRCMMRILRRARRCLLREAGISSSCMRTMKPRRCSRSIISSLSMNCWRMA